MKVENTKTALSIPVALVYLLGSPEPAVIIFWGLTMIAVLANQLARLAVVRYTIIVPLILTFVLLGAFSANRGPLDLVTVVAFGVLGIFYRCLPSKKGI
jgi:TctA family transporter